MRCCWWSVTLKKTVGVRLMNRRLIILAASVLAACSNRAMYDDMRRHQQTDCLKEPPSRYDECIDRADKSYEEYERERKEVLEDKR